MSINYEDAIAEIKSGKNMRRPVWPEGCYITYNSDTSDVLHPEASIDYVEATGAVMTYTAADFDENASDWESV